MSTQVCPYCRTPVLPEAEDCKACPACGTPHHGECWEENGGCTVFGCAEAPVEEAKVTVGSQDLMPGRWASGGSGFGAMAASTGVAPPPPAEGAEPTGTFWVPQGLGGGELSSPSNTLFPLNTHSGVTRRSYVLLGLSLGYLGLHNLYANRTSVGIIQLCATLMTCLLGLPVVWIWALIEVSTVDRDGEGHLMC